MKWKQFFTPVKSMTGPETRSFINETPGNEFTLLDVRQPSEYQESHIPGATLIPFPELSDRMGEIDPQKPVLVYWAIGGRSRVAAQMLSGKGFDKVYNISGGIKGYQGNVAVGPQTQGLELFSGNESLDKNLLTAYSLEIGLRQFYLSMADETDNSAVRDLFSKLADIEIIHQDRLLKEYQDRVDPDTDKQALEAKVDDTVLEGGMTSSEYLELFKTDLNVPAEVIAMAMSIEAQALDLYERAAKQADTPESRDMLYRIANEEKQHLRHLGELIDSL